MEEIEEKIDNYEIIACITLLASYAVIINIKNNLNFFASSSIVISTLCLVLSLFSLLWNKYRFNYRKKIFGREKEEVVSRHAKEIARALEDFINPRLKVKLQGEFIFRLMEAPHKVKDFVEDGNEPEFLEKTIKDSHVKKAAESVIKENYDSYYRVISSFTKNLVTDMEKLNKEIFFAPLKEKAGRIKYCFDVISRCCRHYFFVFGITFFFISIFISLVSR